MGQPVLAQAVEAVEELVELAVDHGFVADQAVEVVFEREDDLRPGELDAGHLVEHLLGDGAHGIAATVGDRLGLVADDALETPVADGQSLDEEPMGRADGAVFVDQLVVEAVEILASLGVVVGEDDVAAEQAVFEGVLAGGGLALGGGWAGGFGGVGLVGGDFGFGGWFVRFVSWTWVSSFLSELAVSY